MTTETQCRLPGCDDEAWNHTGFCQRHYRADYRRRKRGAVLRTGTVAYVLGVSRETVRRWCATGLLPCSTSGGGQHLVTIEGLDSYLREFGGDQQWARYREVTT